MHDLSEKLPDDECHKIKTFIDKAQLHQHERTKTQQQRKFKSLIQEKTKITSNFTLLFSKNKGKWVKNLSDRTLSNSNILLLCKGFNFAVSEEKLPTVEMIIATKRAIVDANLNQGEAETLQSKICNILCTNKPPKSNINEDEKKAQRDLTKNDTIVIVLAETGIPPVASTVRQPNHKIWFKKDIGPAIWAYNSSFVWFAQGPQTGTDASQIYCLYQICDI